MGPGAKKGQGIGMKPNMNDLGQLLDQQQNQLGKSKISISNEGEVGSNMMSILPELK